MIPAQKQATREKPPVIVETVIITHMASSDQTTKAPTTSATMRAGISYARECQDILCLRKKQQCRNDYLVLLLGLVGLAL
jgi:hypothetical protein